MKHLYMSNKRLRKQCVYQTLQPKVLAGENLPTISLVITEEELLLKSLEEVQ